MVRSSRVRIALLAASIAALPAALAVPGMQMGLLFLAPALAALACLLAGRFVGEEKLGRLVAAARGRPARRRPAQHGMSPRRPRALMPRGGVLVATSLAVRPPPLTQTTR